MRTKSEAREISPGYSEGLLTARQEQIVLLIARGAHDQEIADLLGITVSTLKRREQQIFDRCGMWNRVELALWFEKRRAEILGLQF